MFIPYLPCHVTRFVGREAEMNHVRQLVADHKLVTLTGTDGVGKTRLALQVAAQVAGDFSGGRWYVDLLPITDRDLVAMAVLSALGLPQHSSLPAMDTLISSIGDRQMLVVLDNCEHLLDACAGLVIALDACPGLKVLATTSESIGVAGEASWRVPSLSPIEQAIELFATRARRIRPEFGIDDDAAAAVAPICRLLGGLPLAIELAAARVDLFSPAEILDGLQHRFGMYNGAVRRGQILRAAVQWSYGLLSEPERRLLKLLAMFTGPFELGAAEAVGANADLARCQVRDHLAALADNSLVVTEYVGGHTRYRLVETVRQYALEKLTESDASTPDDLPTALLKSRENPGTPIPLQLASLQPLWYGRDRLRQGLAWIDSILEYEAAHHGADLAGAQARALNAAALIAAWLDDIGVGDGVADHDNPS